MPPCFTQVFFRSDGAWPPCFGTVRDAVLPWQFLCWTAIYDRFPEHDPYYVRIIVALDLDHGTRCPSGGGLDFPGGAAAMMPALPPTASRRRWQSVSRFRPEQPAGRRALCAPSGDCGNEQLGLGIHSRRGRGLHVLQHHHQDVGIGCVAPPPRLASKRAFGAVHAHLFPAAGTGMPDIGDLPHGIAALNGATVAFLSAGFYFIRRGQFRTV